jgi:hypothetical protein
MGYSFSVESRGGGWIARFHGGRSAAVCTICI